MKPRWPLTARPGAKSKRASRVTCRRASRSLLLGLGFRNSVTQPSFEGPYHIVYHLILHPNVWTQKKIERRPNGNLSNSGGRCTCSGANGRAHLNCIYSEPALLSNTREFSHFHPHRQTLLHICWSSTLLAWITLGKIFGSTGLRKAFASTLTWHAKVRCRPYDSVSHAPAKSYLAIQFSDHFVQSRVIVNNDHDKWM